MKAIILLILACFLWIGPTLKTAHAGDTAMPEIPHKTLVDEQILIGGQPSRDHLREAREAGIRTVVNLRGVDEFDAWAPSEVTSSLGMLYIHIPVAGSNDLDRPAVEAFDRAVAAAGDEPALFHCASGNRVGAMFALRAGLLQDKSVEEALTIGREHGLTGLEDTVREQLESAASADEG